MSDNAQQLYTHKRVNVVGQTGHFITLARFIQEFVSVVKTMDRRTLTNFQFPEVHTPLQARLQHIKVRAQQKITIVLVGDCYCRLLPLEKVGYNGARLFKASF